MDRVVLKRIIEGEIKSDKPLRDTEIVCVVIKYPEVGQCAVFMGEPKDTTNGENARLITTSIVKSVDNSYGDTTYFETESGSKYAISVE